jgi:hypothetical protein
MSDLFNYHISANESTLICGSSMLQSFTFCFGRCHAMHHPDIDQLPGADGGKDAPFSGEAERVIPDRV